MSNQVPDRLINYRAFLNGTVLVGTVDVELPSLEAMTETLSGAGIAGEIDSPILGHFGSMGLTINWRTISLLGFQLAAQEWHALEFRGAQQIHDPASGKLITQPLRVATRAMPKNLSLGTLAVAAQTGTSHEFEVSYLRADLDNKKALELDKFNYIYDVGTGNLLDPVRTALGLN